MTTVTGSRHIIGRRRFGAQRRVGVHFAPLPDRITLTVSITIVNRDQARGAELVDLLNTRTPTTAELTALRALETKGQA